MAFSVQYPTVLPIAAVVLPLIVNLTDEVVAETVWEDVNNLLHVDVGFPVEVVIPRLKETDPLATLPTGPLRELTAYASIRVDEA